MKLSTRRIIMFTFIGVFIILAPVVIFYASGYRFDTKRVKLLRTGTLLIEAKGVKDIKVFLNNEPYKDPMNEKLFIYNLLPGDYDVRLEKEGYYTWAKKVSITSGLTTFANNIIMFKNQLPEQIIEGNIIDLFPSPDQQKIVYILETDSFWELYQIDLNNYEAKFLYRIAPQKGNLALTWAASSKKILTKIDSTYLIFNTENLTDSQDIKEITNFTPKQCVWDAKSDSLIYCLKNNQPSETNPDLSEIYKIDLTINKSEKIMDSPLEILNSNFTVIDNDIFYIIKEDNRNALYKYNLSFQTNKKAAGLNNSADYRFIPSANNRLALLDNSLQKLYLISLVNSDQDFNLNTEKNVLEFDAKDAAWNKKENQLLIYNDFEISIYNLESGEKTFINRYGQVIKKILWYPSESYLVINFENKIEIIDLSLENGNHNVTDIVKFDKINNFDLDKKGETLYFCGQIGKQQGLYRLGIKDK